MPLLTQDATLKRRPIVFHFPHYTHATGPFTSILDGDWKLIRFYNDTTGRYQLFNLAADPYEQDDLTGQMTERVNSMQAKISSWQQAAGARMPRPNSAFDPAKRPKKDKSHSWRMATGEWKTHREDLRQADAK